MQTKNAPAAGPPQQRLLLALTSFDPARGGIPSVNRNVVRALQTADNNTCKAIVYLDPADLELSPAYRRDGRFLEVNCRSRRRTFPRHFIMSCLSGWTDLVFVDHLHLAVVPYLCRRFLPRGYALFCHGVEFDDRVSHLRERALRNARLLLANTDYTANRLMAKFPGVRIETCQLGLDDLALPDAEADSPSAYPDAFGVLRPLKDRVVLIVGRLAGRERHKGHDELIAAMLSVSARCPGAQLLIVGAGNDLDRLRSVARQSGAGNAILFSGFVSGRRLGALYARCRVFALPSRGEGFGLVFLEAMRFAKPCIASRVDGGREVVADGVTGAHVDPDNLNEIAQALERLLSDDDLNRRLGRAGLERLNQHFLFKHFRDRLLRQLGKILPELESGIRSRQAGSQAFDS